MVTMQLTSQSEGYVSTIMLLPVNKVCRLETIVIINLR